MALSRKRKFIIGGIIGVILVGVLAVSMLASNREAPEVTVAEVKQLPKLESKVTASGEVRPVKFYNLTAEVSGRITNLYVREGDDVKKGQPLIKVDPTQLAEQVAGSAANVNAAIADASASQAAVNSAENNVYTSEASLASATVMEPGALGVRRRRARAAARATRSSRRTSEAAGPRRCHRACRGAREQESSAVVSEAVVSEAEAGSASRGEGALEAACCAAETMAGESRP